MNKKKLLALLMALVMVLTLVPVTAVAEVSEAIGGGESGPDVARNDDLDFYPTLAEAFAAAADGDTITLLANVSENVTVAADKNIVIDLAGHTINGGTVANAPAITNNGTLEIKDTVGGGIVKREDTGTSGYYVIDNAGTLIISSGTYTNGTGSTSEHSGASLIRTRENATLTINGGTLNQEYFNVLKDEGNCTVNITGGTINCAGAEYAILTYGNLNISGGTINGPVDIRGYDSISGAATISGGTFNSKFYVEQYTGHHASTNPSLIIEGGQFTTDAGTFNVGEGKKPSEFTADSTCGTIVISGGVFTTQPDAGLIKTGYQVIDNPDEATVGTYPYTVKFKYSGQIAWNAESDKDIEITDGMSVTNVWLMLNKTSGFNFGEISFGSEDADEFDTIEEFYNSFLNYQLERSNIQGYMEQFGVSSLTLTYTSIVFPTVDAPADVDVCTVDEEGYRSVKLAVEAIANSPSKTGTIVMVQNYTTACAVEIPEDVNVTLDLAGHTLTGGPSASNRSVYAIENYGTFTLEDSVGNGEIRARGISNEVNGVMTIDGAKVVEIDANGGAAVWNEGNLVINDGTFSTTYVGSASETGGPACLSNQTTGTAQINGGLFQSVNNRAYAVMNYGTMVVDNATVDGTHGGISCDTGSLTINGGSYTAKNYYGLWITNNGNVTDVTVNGGSFKGGSQGKNAIRASVDDGKQDVSDATIRITGGKFEGYSGNAAAVAVNKSGSAHSWGMNITGGVFSTKPDASYVADGYEAVLLSNANQYGGENENYDGWYKVGKVVTTSDTNVSAEEINTNTVNYTVKTEIVDSNNNATTLENLGSQNAITVRGTSNSGYADTAIVPATPSGTTAVGDVALNQLKDAPTIKEIIQSAINSAGSSAGDANSISVVLVSDGGKTESTNNTVTKITYEVHPEAIVYNSSSDAIGSYAIKNEELGDTNFSFKLAVPDTLADVGEKVNVTHKHNGTSENLGAFTVEDDHTITLTGISSFSEFELQGTDANAVNVTTLGASLRRRVRTNDHTQVVNTSTDFRMTYQWTLPDGVSLDTTEGACYFLWSKDNGETWKKVNITDFSETTASIVITGVPKVAFDTTIKSKIHLKYTGNAAGEIEVSGYDRSVTYVATELAKLGNDNMWGAYGNHLLSSNSTYTIDGGSFIFCE